MLNTNPVNFWNAISINLIVTECICNLRSGNLNRNTWDITSKILVIQAGGRLMVLQSVASLSILRVRNISVVIALSRCKLPLILFRNIMGFLVMVTGRTLVAIQHRSYDGVMLYYRVGALRNRYGNRIKINKSNNFWDHMRYFRLQLKCL